MHRTTVTFNHQDWQQIRRLALERKMGISELISLAIGKLFQETSSAPKTRWKFTWQPKNMGKPNGDFRTREGLYEFFSR